MSKPDTAGVPECLACGACCFASDPTYLRVFGVDEARLASLLERYTVELPQGRYMRLAGGRCAALALEVETSRYVCSIYPQRPDVCRHLERGSAQCRRDVGDKRVLAEGALSKLRRAATGA